MMLEASVMAINLAVFGLLILGFALTLDV